MRYSICMYTPTVSLKKSWFNAIRSILGKYFFFHQQYTIFNAIALFQPHALLWQWHVFDAGEATSRLSLASCWCKLRFSPSGNISGILKQALNKIFIWKVWRGQPREGVGLAGRLWRSGHQRPCDRFRLRQWGDAPGNGNKFRLN